ncbi:MAG TPA: LAGLIDADG family homing endonuclease [Candidatus Nanoarchaeia archaeon]|nr:LAGLIDADG family homing endonuclease [Candidatus Nanoarchaeia archaeon]
MLTKKNNYIYTMPVLSQLEKVFVKVDDEFTDFIKEKLITGYGSLKQYNQAFLGIEQPTFEWAFKKKNGHELVRLINICTDLNIIEEDVFEQIKGFYRRGSHNKNAVLIPSELKIDEFFVEGYALYLAEGDTGFSGRKKPRKFRFTNSEINVINHMIRWIKTYFPNNYFYVSVINPRDKHINFDEIKERLKTDSINLRGGSYNKIVKYRINFDQAIIIDLILSIESRIKELCLQDKKLAAAYVRGMMIGEGTAYFKRSRYVRIEMRNEKEIKYIHELLTFLGYDCKPSLRSERHDMWSVYIGAKQLAKFYREIGFGVHEKRQRILEKAVNKRLRINQHC